MFILTIAHEFQTFSLGSFYGHYLDLIWHIKRLKTGSLVTIIVAATGIIGLRDAANVMTTFGSIFAEHLQPSSHWIWVFVKGGKTIFETAFLKSQTAVFAHALSSFIQNNEKIKIHFSSLEHKRWNLCQKVEGLGEFCDPLNPDPLEIEEIQLPRSKVLDDVHVIVSAGSRIQYLYVTLRSLLNSPGVRKSNIEVMLGDITPEVIELLDIMNLSYKRVHMRGKGNGKLFQFYRSVFEHASKSYANSSAVIFLDEDVEVSRDFFSFMSQMILVLLDDRSLFCASGFAPLRSPFLQGRKDYALRVITQPLWGFAVTPQFIAEALQFWSTDITEGSQYDFWLLERMVGERECLIPEVSRTRHFGVGLNAYGEDLEKHFLNTEFDTEYGIRIKNEPSLRILEWQIEMIETLRSAKVLSVNPCNRSFYHNELKDGTYVFYYSLIEEHDQFDYANYMWIGECMGFFSRLDQGWHAGVTTIAVKPSVVVHFMGVPLSPYSRYAKIPHENAWSFNKLVKEEQLFMVNVTRSMENEAESKVIEKYLHPTYHEDIFRDHSHQ